MTTPAKRTVLELFSRDQLLAAVDQFGLEVADRRAKAGLVEAVTLSRKAALPAVLEPLARDRLKELCRELGLQDAGREKAVLIARLCGTPPPSAEPHAEDAPTPLKAKDSATATAAAPRSPKGPSRASVPPGSGATLGFEAKLWGTADKLRNNMDAAEYKHVVLGLIFLK